MGLFLFLDYGMNEEQTNEFGKLGTICVMHRNFTGLLIPAVGLVSMAAVLIGPSELLAIAMLFALLFLIYQVVNLYFRNKLRKSFGILRPGLMRGIMVASQSQQACLSPSTESNTLASLADDVENSAPPTEVTSFPSFTDRQFTGSVIFLIFAIGASALALLNVVSSLAMGAWILYISTPAREGYARNYVCNPIGLLLGNGCIYGPASITFVRHWLIAREYNWADCTVLVPHMDGDMRYIIVVSPKFKSAGQVFRVIILPYQNAVYFIASAKTAGLHIASSN